MKYVVLVIIVVAMVVMGYLLCPLVTLDNKPNIQEGPIVSMSAYLNTISVMMTTVSVALATITIGIAIVATFTFRGIKETAT